MRLAMLVIIGFFVLAMGLMVSSLVLQFVSRAFAPDLVGLSGGAIAVDTLTAWGLRILWGGYTRHALAVLVGMFLVNGSVFALSFTAFFGSTVVAPTLLLYLVGVVLLARMFAQAIRSKAS